ncbi:hypothetical protein U1701_01560 [Sphingomonas sp. PB2P19]|uniref:hypothetical protein n=1 Tax=Sphingomonas rhamnosi TaxID=3096156 RepID=UPI002FC96481
MPIAIALLLLAQAAPAAPERFSILVDPCASASDDKGTDIIVCGRPEKITPRLPLRDFRGVPDRPVPSNPDMLASVALDGKAAGNECGAYGEDCPVGLGGYALPVIVNGAVGLVKSALAKKPDKRGRVPILLDDPAPPKPAP